MGLEHASYRHGFPPAVRALMRKPGTRTAEQQQRARARAAWRAKLRSRPVAVAAGSSLLNGHAAPHSPELLRLIPVAQQYGLVVTSTLDGQHAPNSYHYSGHAVDFSRSDWPTAAGTEAMLRFQHHLLARRGHLRELFGP